VFGIMFLIPDTLPILLKYVTVKNALSLGPKQDLIETKQL